MDMPIPAVLRKAVYGFILRTHATHVSRQRRLTVNLDPQNPIAVKMSCRIPNIGLLAKKARIFSQPAGSHTHTHTWFDRGDVRVYLSRLAERHRRPHHRHRPLVTPPFSANARWLAWRCEHVAPPQPKAAQSASKHVASVLSSRTAR